MHAADTHSYRYNNEAGTAPWAENFNSVVGAAVGGGEEGEGEATAGLHQLLVEQSG